MQMLGRAGRPQFETEACAVILCLKDRVQRYEKIVAGEEVLESALHQNLVEHLNAEIGIGTIKSISSAQQWLAGTFLNTRLQQNPQYYNLSSDQKNTTPDDLLYEWCEEALSVLENEDLIENQNGLKCTGYGDAMARYCVKFDTVKKFMAVTPQAKVSEILTALSQAAEFDDFRLKQGERGVYKEMNRANGTRYPIKVDIALTQHKVTLLIQAKLGSVTLAKEAKSKVSGSQQRQINIDTIGVIVHAKRLIRCMVDILVQRNDSMGVKNALELGRGLAAGVWDDTAMQLKQIPGIGDVAVRKLASANIKTIDTLQQADAGRIELVLSKNPPYGHEIKSKAAALPMLHVSAKSTNNKQKVQEGAEVKVHCDIGFLNVSVPLTFDKRPYSVLFLCETSAGELIDFRRFSPSRLKNGQEILLTALIRHSDTSIYCHTMCDDLAGTHRFAEVKLDCPAWWFPSEQSFTPAKTHEPILITEPIHEKESDEFGNEGLDDLDLLRVVQSPARHSDEIIVDNIDDIMPDAKSNKNGVHSRKRSHGESRDESEKRLESHKLPNGRWSCNHSCVAEGKQCKHKCCAEGVKRKPSRSAAKRQKTDKNADVKKAHLNIRKSKSPVTESSTSEGLLYKMFNKSQAKRESEWTDSRTIANACSNGDFSAAIQKNKFRTLAADPNEFDMTGASTTSNLKLTSLDTLDLASEDWDRNGNATSFSDGPLLQTTTCRNPPKLEELDEFDEFLQVESSFACKTNNFSSPEKRLFLTPDDSPNKPLENSNFRNTWDIAPTEISVHSDQRDTNVNESLRHSEPSLTQQNEFTTGFKLHAIENVAQPDVDPTVLSYEPTEDAELEKQKLHEEDQKRRWAEISSDWLNYENFGRYVTIVDSVE